MGGSSSKQVAEVYGPPKTVNELLRKKLLNRSSQDRLWFGHATTALTAFSAFSGLVINSTIRRHLMVYESVFVTSTVVAIVSSSFSFAVRRYFVEEAILDGKLTCSICASIRGIVAQGVAALFIPSVVAFSFCGIIADRYKGVDLPDFEIPPSKEYREFLKREVPKVVRKLRIPIVLQLYLGALLSYKQSLVANDLHSSVTNTELQNLWEETGRSMKDCL